jgi:transcriptional regulator with XRE-family HTH domain
MSYPVQIKTEAISLRRKGFSLNEIVSKLYVSKSTISEWVSSIELSLSAQKRLADRQIIGQYKSVLLKRKSAEEQRKLAQEVALRNMEKIFFPKELLKLCCALVWWCEGNKDTSLVRFTSSDGTLIANFLSLLRSGFAVDESKFRALVHIHVYHNDKKQKKYWSQVTKIPLKQFYSSYQKPNTGKRIKAGYPGCVAVSYYDAKIAKELEALYNAFTTHRGVR